MNEIFTADRKDEMCTARVKGNGDITHHDLQTLETSLTGHGDFDVPCGDSFKSVCNFHLDIENFAISGAEDVQRLDAVFQEDDGQSRLSGRF